MKRKVTIICLLLGSILFTGGNAFAAYSIDNLESFEKVPLAPADVMPSKAQLSGRRARVIVYNFDDYQWRGGGEIAGDMVVKELSDTGVTLVDQALAYRLKREIERAETSGYLGNAKQSVADYAITGKITQAGINRSNDRSTGKRSTTANVSVTINITQLPSLLTVKTISEDGREVIEGDGRPELLLTAALEKVIVKAHTQLKNQFAPSGYVLEHRALNDTHIFKVSLDKTAGAKAGLKVIFFKSVQDKNPLTGVVSVDQVKIAEGEITEEITDSYSYVVVKEKSGIDKIRLGDTVKVLYKNSLWDHMKMI